MADISTELAKLRDARYGEEVRGAIISSIEKMNEEAENAEAWATGGSGGTPGPTNNAQYYAEAAETAAASADARARAWGDGTTPEGDPIPSTDPAYGKSARDYAGQAETAVTELYGAPAGYVRLKYLQSDGAVGINVELKMNQDSRVVCRYAAVEPKSIGASTGYLFGSRYSTSQYVYAFGQYAPTLEYPSDRWIAGYDGGSKYVSYETYPFDTRWHTVDFSANVVKIDGKTAATFNESSGFECNNNLRLFALISYTGSGTATYLYGLYKVSECWIYQDGAMLSRHLIPVRRVSDDALGLYDLVNDVFLVKRTNDTGDFISGGDANIGDIYDTITPMEEDVEDLRSDLTDDVDTLESELEAVLTPTTVDGSPATLEDCVPGARLRGLTVNVGPVQNGTGTPASGNVRDFTGFTTVRVSCTGNNLWGGEQFKDDILRVNSSATVSGDTIRLNSSSLGGNPIWLFPRGSTKRYTVLVQYTNTVSGTAGNAPLGIYYTDGTYDKWGNRSTPGMKQVPTTSGKRVLRIGGLSQMSTTVNFMGTGIFEGVLPDGSEAEPYIGSVYNVFLPEEAGPVYGGVLDVINGTLTVTHGHIPSYDDTEHHDWLTGAWLSSIDEYEEGTYPTDGAEVVYELEVPMGPYNITPRAVKTMATGVTKVFSDTGTVEVTYLKNPVPVEPVDPYVPPEFREDQVGRCYAAKRKFTGTNPIIVHISDIHGDSTRMNRALDLADMIGADTLCLSGDIVSQSPSDGYAWLHDAIANHTTKPVICTGNHDVGATTSSTISDDTVYNNIFDPSIDRLMTEEEQTGKCWYYTDSASNLLRYISIHLYEYGGSSRNYTHLSDEQLAWFANALKDTPDGYGIIVLVHTTPYRPAKATGYEKFYDSSATWHFIDMHYSVTGDPISDIVTAFNARSTIQDTYPQTGSPSSVSVDASFTTVTPAANGGPEFIAFLTGHIHEDRLGLVPSSNMVRRNDWQLDLNISAAYISGSTGLPRVSNTYMQDLINVYGIDRVNKTVKVVRVGSDLRHDMTYSDVMVIPYTEPGV